MPRSTDGTLPAAAGAPDPATAHVCAPHAPDASTPPRLLTAAARENALALRDLADPAQGPHAMQLLLDRIVGALRNAWECDTRIERAQPIVTVRDNYDALHYAAGAAARDVRYTRYITPETVLRTHTTAMIPPLLRRLAASGRPRDALLVCPGLVYRRDTIDRLHNGEPHQCDLWRIVRGRLAEPDLHHMVAIVLAAVLPGRAYRLMPADHPYTIHGRQIDVLVDGEWVEVGECGIALPVLLDECGLDRAEYSGLAMGIGLDRLLMLVKHIADIRLLRADDPRIASQMLDLSPYRPVSDQPASRRDLSVAVAADRTPEEIGDRVREALGEAAASLEAVEILSETPAAALPAAAAERIGIRSDQKNVLLRVVIRHATRTLTTAEANVLRDRVYAAVHEGTMWQWAAREAAHGPPARRTPGGE